MRSSVGVEYQACGGSFSKIYRVEVGMGLGGAEAAARSLTHAHVLRSLVRIVEGLAITERDIAALDTARAVLADRLSNSEGRSEYERWAPNDSTDVDKMTAEPPPDQIDDVLTTLATVKLMPDASPETRALFTPVREFFRSWLLKETRATQSAGGREGAAWPMLSR